ncbi:beta-glucan synthesis-associated protein KRE6 [Lachancea thermotolerans CBS 6340]|uniref:KLTH0G02112p n=1 Tax=Lachancea thermotolerans (strain ATCC 56472 / CBS 6340 / NRRL Y-8284) TaxID=559295 RepID=C5DLN4_LACTC|nr:KLTH0G02112p [Lachancea thermotolerans CBS 6340]CAR24695.1 KLTH0G02112p [Lachancea thermotolerans CBS 6340]
MSVRNLTSNTREQQASYSGGDQGNASASQNVPVRNPFTDDAEDDTYASYSASDTSLLHHDDGASATDAAGAAGSAAVGSRDVSDYKGYYSKGAAGARLTPGSRAGPAALPSSSSLSSHTGISNNDITAPPGFDRYPVVGSRVASMAPVGGAAAVGAAGAAAHNGSHNNSSASISSSDPFISDQDFSPFGGYPTSSFPLHLDEKEDDDYLHNPDPEEEARLDNSKFMLDFKHMDRRSAGGFFGFLFLFLGALTLFVVLPVLTFTGAVDHGKPQTITYLSLYEYPQLSAIRTSLVDPDTPTSAKTWKAKDGSEWPLAFSDEFNAEGRTFYDGDDQFWTAPDFHYAATHDLEWYSPDAVTTANGTLKLRMDAYKNHDLYYRSGMLQSWNKLCFTQGYIEASANLPNYGRVIGLWPGMWTMGNLGRPGYLASTEGVWPYSYEACDAGITPNQSSPDGISYLPGQKLSSCTCDGEDHPNQGVGRGAPEIDIIEGSADTYIGGSGVGVASQSLQLAPFDIWYMPDYDFIEIHNSTVTAMNTYAGGPFQQAVSAVTALNVTWNEFGPDAGYFQSYGFEYLNDHDTGYIRWFVGQQPTMTIHSTALHPNGNINWRPISKEPMSIILNLGISNNWAYIDWNSIFFPVTMSIDYVRIYQPENATSITCDPSGFPTYQYIQDHLNVYSNVNLTSWEDAGYTFPKNTLTGNCKSSKKNKDY